MKNTFMIEGNIARGPTIRDGNNGEWATVTIAQDWNFGDRSGTHFIPFVCNRDDAIDALRNMNEGDAVFAVGRLKSRRQETENGKGYSIPSLSITGIYPRTFSSSGNQQGNNTGGGSNSSQNQSQGQGQGQNPFYGSPDAGQPQQ